MKNKIKLSARVNQLGWWILFLVSTFYSIYALYMGALEILHLLGLLDNVKFRAAPLIFIIHALSGSAGLISGALQFNRKILNKRRFAHQLIGMVYVYAIWITSIAALWNAIYFGVSMPAKIAFGTLAMFWFSTTTIAFVYIRRHKIREHREWMIRSYSLSLFFVTFSFWAPGLTDTTLPYDVPIRWRFF